MGQFAHAVGFWRKADRVVYAIGPTGDDFSDRAVVDLLDRVFQRFVVAAHQPAGNLEVLLGGLLAGVEHAANARGVDRKRFLHEDIDSLLDRVFEVDRPEGGRSGQHHDAAGIQRVDRLSIAVHADELPLLGHIHLFLELLGEGLQAGLEAVLEDVGHRPELGGATGAQGVCHCAGASPAAAHQRNFDRVALGRIRPGGNGV